MTIRNNIESIVRTCKIGTAIHAGRDGSSFWFKPAIGKSSFERIIEELRETIDIHIIKVNAELEEMVFVYGQLRCSVKLRHKNGLCCVFIHERYLIY